MTQLTANLIHPASTKSTPSTPSLLRSILRENAVFSILSGAVLTAGSPGLDSWLGVHAIVLLIAGVGLIGYGASVWFGASRAATVVETGKVAVAGDVGWILAAVVLIAATSVLTRNGELALAIVSVPVALFAIGQVIGLRRLAA